MDREKVIKALEYCITGDCGSCFYRQQCIKTGIKRDALTLLKSQPQIVRCSDCKHWEKYSDIPNIGNCPVLDQSRRCDWFCADGERRTDDA